VHEDTVRKYVEGRAAAADSSDDPCERLGAVMRAGVPPWANEHVIRVLYEMHGLARRSEDHAELLSDLWRHEHELYVEIIDDGVAKNVFTSTRAVHDVATRLLALEDGLVLHLIGHNRMLSSDNVVKLFMQSAASELDCPQLLTNPAIA
ncbi:TetR family transcriptional regulator C-terminal domain-containing protein, partial [Amycolatopsis lurida]